MRIHAKQIDCVLTESLWMTPTVMRIRFEPKEKFNFRPGQFLSLVVPPKKRGGQTVKRCYSFASGPEQSRLTGYEICVKYVAHGLGSEYLASLKMGDHFKIFAPYGHFVYEAVPVGESVCFVATSSGIGPMRSIAESNLFQDHRPHSSTLILGVRYEEDLLYRGEFEALGVRELCAVSQPTEKYQGFEGRVTDMLRAMTNQISWQSTHFYLCGNAEMICETREVLMSHHGVPAKSIKQESFTGVVKAIQKPFKPVLLPKAA